MANMIGAAAERMGVASAQESPKRIGGPITNIRGSRFGGARGTEEKDYEQMLREKSIAERNVAEELDPTLRIARENKELQLADLQRQKDFLKSEWMSSGGGQMPRLSFTQWMNDPGTVRSQAERQAAAQRQLQENQIISARALTARPRYT